MTPAALTHAATQIIRLNLTQNVIGAAVLWDADTAHLKLTYLCEAAPTEDDSECQELSMCELIAQFPDIVTAECNIALMSEWHDDSPNSIKVYARAAA